MRQADDSVDLFVIGGGSGGVRAARVAARHGARVALAEEYRVGGTCVIRGCVPKKLMVLASRFGAEFEAAAGFGWSVGERDFHWPALKAQVDREVARLEQVYTDNLRNAGVALHADRAVLDDAHTVRLVQSGRRFHAERILIATGNAPQMSPAIPGGELAASSNDFFLWPEQPKRVVVQGSGYIAVELACLLQRLGSAVTLVFRSDRILRGFDDELRSHLQDELAATGLVIRSGASVDAIERDAASGALRVSLSGGPVLDADAVLRALGRRPASAGLGLEGIGVTINPDGAIAVDAFAQTTVPHIYAVGDVTDRVTLTPAAIREGQAFADSVYGGRPTPVQHELVPSAVFTTPEAASVGTGEEEAVARHGAVDVYVARFRPMKATLSGQPGRVLMKLVVQRETDRVLGCHIVGPEAGEMIQLIGIALQMGARKADLDATLAVHPTAAEELVTMRTPTRTYPLPAAVIAFGSRSP